jgi:hypothetical protein
LYIVYVYCQVLVMVVMVVEAGINQQPVHHLATCLNQPPEDVWVVMVLVVLVSI